MSTTEEVKKEIEELGRLSVEQEDFLYLLSMRQDELGRQTTNMLKSVFDENPLYKDLIEREYLTVQDFNYGKDASKNVVSLYVTLKGMRYCLEFVDELDERRLKNEGK